MPLKNGNARPDPHYALAVTMLTEFQKTWNSLYEKHKADPVTFSRLSVVSLTQLGAVVGVDVGMTEEQFVAVCRAQYHEAYKRAPKFS